MMVILWFVFTVGLKAGPREDGISFFAWFFTASVAWNFLSDALIVSTSVFHEYSYLVKKISFKVAILPAVKLLSSLILHLIFLGILAVVLMLNGIFPNWYWLGVIYYLLAMMILLLGLGWIVSSLNVFVKDVGQIVGIVLQFGFWLTPIMWETKNIPEKYAYLIKLNPAYYITEGYRKAFLFRIPIWEEGIKQTVYFWGFTLVVLLCGILIFKKLRPHFGDVI